MNFQIRFLEKQQHQKPQKNNRFHRNINQLSWFKSHLSLSLVHQLSGFSAASTCASLPAGDVGPWPADHRGLQTGPGQACLLRTGGAAACWEKATQIRGD